MIPQNLKVQFWENKYVKECQTVPCPNKKKRISCQHDKEHSSDVKLCLLNGKAIPPYFSFPSLSFRFFLTAPLDCFW